MRRRRRLADAVGSLEARLHKIAGLLERAEGDVLALSPSQPATDRENPHP